MNFNLKRNSINIHSLKSNIKDLKLKQISVIDRPTEHINEYFDTAFDFIDSDPGARRVGFGAHAVVAPPALSIASGAPIATVAAALARAADSGVAGDGTFSSRLPAVFLPRSTTDAACRGGHNRAGGRPGYEL